MSKNSLRAFLDEIAELPDFFEVQIKGPNTSGLYGNTPLHIAAVRGDCVAGKMLITAGSMLNPKGEHGYTPLHEAVEQGHVPFVKLLIEAGADPKIKNDNGETPLALARLTENAEIEQILKIRMQGGKTV